MIVVGALCFWIAALVHVAIAVVQESFAGSLLRVYGSIAATVVLATLVFGGNYWQTFFFGGNIILLSYLLGWFSGDYLRGD
jgi:hypothetical protein